MRTQRPTPTWRDYGWLLFAAVATAWSLRNVVAVMAATASGSNEWWEAVWLALFWTAVGYLVGMGSWRRTIWRCPYSHNRRSNGRPACRRHQVADDGVG